MKREHQFVGGLKIHQDLKAHALESRSPPILDVNFGLRMKTIGIPAQLFNELLARIFSPW